MNSLMGIPPIDGHIRVADDDEGRVNKTGITGENNIVR